MVTQAAMGRGDDQLGTLLMLNFLRTLKEMGNALWRLVFVNAGVKLTIEGTDTLPVLQELEKRGSLHFGLRDLPEPFRPSG